MELAFQIIVGCTLLAVALPLAVGWVFAIPTDKSFGRDAFLIGVPLLWLAAVAAWLYWLGGWHAVWVVAGIALLGPYVRGRLRRRASEDRGPRVVPAAPSPRDDLKG